MRTPNRKSDIRYNEDATRDRMRESRMKQRNRRFMFAVQLSLSGVLLYYILKKLKK